MAGYTPKLVDTGFQHWIKANLALNITKDGIKDAVYNKTNTFHQDALNDILTPEQIKNNDFCTQCTIQNIMPCRTKGICIVNAGVCSFHQSTHYHPCPKHICDQLKDKIRKCHRYNKPSWKNTRPERWCQYPWELAKCYFPPDGYNAVNTIEETDLNGILSLLLNHNAFKSIVDELNCDETREIGRRVRHSPSLCIDENDMNSYLDTLVKLLRSSSLFQADSSATESVQKLKQLKADSLTIASEEVTKVLQDVIQENTRGSVEVINQIAAQRASEIKADLHKLEVVRSPSLNDILTAKTTAISDIDRSKVAGISEIDKNKESAIFKIDKRKNASISEIDKNRESAISEMNKSKHAGISEIDKNKECAISDMDMSKHAGISEIDKNKDSAISEMDKSKHAGISDIVKNKDDAISEIGKSKDVGISEIDKQIHTGVEDIKLVTEQLKLEARSDIKQLGQSSSKEMQQGPATMTDAVYYQLKSEFKEDLLTFNRENHSKIPISPLLEETDTDIVCFYVPPNLSRVELHKPTLRGPCSEVRRPIQDFKDVFYNKSKRCSNVFLTSEAGQGKTAFCKYLTLIWCDAHQNNKERQYITDTELYELQEFNFLFHISLRDVSSTDCDIDDMIQNQIVQYLSRAFKYNAEFVQELLHRERHLVILDGLDEWTHPDPTSITCRKKRDYLPHRKAREKCTILTTTRSWKLSIAKLKTNQIDNHIEIGSLDEEALNQMLNNMVTKICLRQNQNTDDDISQNIKDISEEIRSRSIPDFEVNPLILTYLICLWVEGKPLGRSKCEIYSNILEMFLFRLKENNPTIESNASDLQTCGNPKLPLCFETKGHIKSFYSSLLPLGRLAFEALFNKNMERSLVFDTSFAKDILTEKALSFCFATGLLVQSKVPGQLTTRETRISFSHKTFQEFFAALYIQSQSDPSGVIKQVLVKCHNVENILEMSNVLIFLSGLSPERACLISKKFYDVINEANMTISYRHNNHFYMFARKPFQDLQNMYIACIKECHDNTYNTIKLRLSDLFIDKESNNEAYFCNLQTLILTNIKNIKSVFLGYRTSEGNTGDIITRFHLRDIQTLETLLLYCSIITDDLECLLTASAHTLKQVYVSGVQWHGNHYTQACNVISDASVNAVSKMRHLQSLALENSKLSHSQLKRLTCYLIERTSMKEIVLCNIICSDHLQSCNGFSMDLSKHSQLKCVGLADISLSHLQINTSRLETCLLGKLQNSITVSSVLRSLSGARNLKYIEIFELESVLDLALETIPQLVHLQRIGICATNMTERKLKLSRDMVGIECIKLQGVTMSCASFEQLVRDVEMFQQSVQVNLFVCNVTPTEEYERMKNYIKLSDRFVVYDDGKVNVEWSEEWYAFIFESNSLESSGSG